MTININVFKQYSVPVVVFFCDGLNVETVNEMKLSRVAIQMKSIGPNLLVIFFSI